MKTNFNASVICKFGKNEIPCKCSLFKSSRVVKPTRAPITTAAPVTLAPGQTSTMSSTDLLCVRMTLHFQGLAIVNF